MNSSGLTGYTHYRTLSAGLWTANPWMGDSCLTLPVVSVWALAHLTLVALVGLANPTAPFLCPEVPWGLRLLRTPGPGSPLPRVEWSILEHSSDQAC